MNGHILEAMEVLGAALAERALEIESLKYKVRTLEEELAAYKEEGAAGLRPATRRV